MAVTSKQDYFFMCDVVMFISSERVAFTVVEFTISVNFFVHLFVYVTIVSNGKKLPVVIESVAETDYSVITKRRFSFNWKLEQRYNVYKMTAQGFDEILGVISLEVFGEEQRIAIRLLAVQNSYVGKNKKLERIAGNLLAFAAHSAILKFGSNAAISMIPKTELGQHYMTKYRFLQAGRSLYMEGARLMKLLDEYDHD